jgi:hypothetical protein
MLLSETIVEYGGLGDSGFEPRCDSPIGNSATFTDMLIHCFQNSTSGTLKEIVLFV